MFLSNDVLSVCLYSLSLVSMLVFSAGYFATRKHSSSISECSQSPIMGPQKNHCWKSFSFNYSQFSLILIDALRADFCYSSNAQSPPPLAILQKESNANKGQLFQFIADPPTATAQRLDAITSGSIPLFSDALSTFASSETSKDNWLNQFIEKNKNVFFFGDDTWIKMFPKLSSSKGLVKGHWSFGLFDLHTIDDAILENYSSTLAQPKDALIMHFLGLDHCGHKYNANHDKCVKKLEQYDDFIQKFLVNVEAKTANSSHLVIIFGDHGMTDSGDHGGSSSKEVTSALYINRPKANILQDLMVKAAGIGTVISMMFRIFLKMIRHFTD